MVGRGFGDNLQQLTKELQMNLLVILIVSVFGARLFNRKKASVKKHEYLEILTFFSWKSERTLWDEMQRKKRGWIVESKTHKHLLELVKEGLVVHRIGSELIGDPETRTMCYINNTNEFRLTSHGARGRFETPTHADLHGCGQVALP